MSKHPPVDLSFFSDEGWLEIDLVPHSDWQRAVKSGDTLSGYFEFVVDKLNSMNRIYTFEDQRVEQELMDPSPKDPVDPNTPFVKDWWQSEVENLDTRRGYQDWVQANTEALQADLSQRSDQDATVDAPSSFLTEVPRPRRSSP